jgi:Tfp pilus assembly protein PilZ
VKNIGIAKNIDWTESSLRDTIVHEMIHAYLYQNGMPYLKHGKVFKTVMRELNKKYGLNVEIIDTENWFNDKKPTLFQRITRWLWIKIRLAI